MSKIESAYKGVCEEIAKFCKQNTVPKPTLVAVSKYHPVEEIQQLYNLGHREFGENYVQELTQKAQQLPKDIKWHFIGNLQSNKCKIAGDIPNLYAVETLDTKQKASKLNKYRTPETQLKVFIQVNTSGEAQKAGVSADEAVELAKYIVQECPNLKFEGLMTIGALSESKDSGVNSDFEALVQARQQVEQALGVTGLGLSMGMSSDFLQAMSQGSTNVRIGSTIFGPRPLKEDLKKA